MSNINNNSFRIMWIIAAFDLPTDTPKERKEYREFRKKLLENGFNMFQFSIYLKHVPTFAKAKAITKKIEKDIPKDGNVVFFYLTDKQFGMTDNFIGEKKSNEELPKHTQLLMF